MLYSFAPSDGSAAESGEALHGEFGEAGALAVADTSNTATIVYCTVLLGFFTESPRRMSLQETITALKQGTRKQGPRPPNTRTAVQQTTKPCTRVLWTRQRAEQTMPVKRYQGFPI